MPEVRTKVLWPRKRDTGIAYGRMLLHDTIKGQIKKLYLIFFFTARDLLMFGLS